MIAQLTGTVARTEANSVILDVGGVGYQVFVPVPTLSALPADGSKVTLLTHLVARVQPEFDMALYGFLDATELRAFKMLLGVSGVGAKVALALISSLSVAEMLKLHPQTLRMYEKKGLIRPSRTEGRTRMYSSEDVEDLARVIRLARDLGVNLAGIEIILKMRRRMLDMQRQVEDLTNHVRTEMGETLDAASRGRSEALVRSASSHLKPVDLF